LKLCAFGVRDDELEAFEQENRQGFEVALFRELLTQETAARTAGYDAVTINVHCVIDAGMARTLRECGVRYILTRAAGADHLDLAAIHAEGLKSANVPTYAPNSIAEHTVMLALELLRKRKLQFRRVERYDFRFTGAIGSELRNAVAGVVGTGRIGAETVRDLSGFGCRILACDARETPAVAGLASYLPMDGLLAQSDIVILHCPMNEGNRHLINARTLAMMKEGAMLVNTARGGLVDNEAVLAALDAGRLAGYAFDVYEHEEFFGKAVSENDPSVDETFRKLLRDERVICTGHTAFYTREAVRSMVSVMFGNLEEYASTGSCSNET